MGGERSYLSVRLNVGWEDRILAGFQVQSHSGLPRHQNVPCKAVLQVTFPPITSAGHLPFQHHSQEIRAF